MIGTRRATRPVHRLLGLAVVAVLCVAVAPVGTALAAGKPKQ